MSENRVILTVAMEVNTDQEHRQAVYQNRQSYVASSLANSGERR